MAQRPIGSALGALGGMVGLAVVAGVLVTALVTPALAVTGLATSSSIGMFENLPGYIKPDRLAEKTNIYAVDGASNPVLLASVFDQDREEVGWDQISQFAKDAVVATEDPRFYTHGGVDLASAARAAIENTVESEGPGASTISMQYVRNILVQRATEIADEGEREAAFDDATKTTIDRKLKEMKLAIGLEKEYSKDDILLGYLNIASFGGRVYGIQSAAKYYFGVNASELTLPQAASLIATVNEPNGLRIDLAENLDANTARRNDDVLAAMLAEHRITRAQHDEAVATPVTPVITPPSTGCQSANGIGAGFFCDYVTNIVRNDPAFGTDAETRWADFKTGGYQIYTSLDVDLQQNAQNVMNEYVPMASEVLDLGASLVTVQPGTGRVLAMAQNKYFNQDPEVAAPDNTALNYSTDFDHGGSTGFQVGSTYKMFVLAEWLRNGRSLSEVVNGSPQRFNQASFADSCNGAASGSYAPSNDGGANPGRVTVTTAVQDSVNNAFVAMAQKLDQCAIRKTAEAFGVHRADGSPLTEYVADVLGTNELAPLTMAAAFAAIANNGTYCSPVAIDRIVDAGGEELPVPVSTCSEAVAPEIAAAMAYAMTRVVTAGSGTLSDPDDGIPHIGKTGTTDLEKDTWFVGSSTKLTTAVWVGNVQGTVSLRHNTIAGRNGGDLRHHVWREYMTIADSKYGGDAFPEADAAFVRGSQLRVPDVTGLTEDDARQRLSASGFDADVAAAIDSSVPGGRIAASTPATGESASAGSTVTLVPSNGALRVMPDVVGQTTAAATSELAALQLGPVTFVGVSGGVETRGGTVLGSSPAAGVDVRPGDRIALTVAPAAAPAGG
ncbi:transglycosylase domain-containing protein [Herbiconiux sp. CPCC 205763]|uniref:Transglycosylase domain-containing protein n=1 Tax=Herbiconiux aconitum TaxID=2970913 RepID=A0ABT2GNH9_9MICO|nr:transglycosylase domain-containing protein [Herbiconiux aconitum]MCS5717787.1 transglycosylase domain-containing protein [Herbiconiux aconitum]